MTQLFFTLLTFGVIATASAQPASFRRDYGKYDRPNIERSHQMMDRKQSDIDKINAKYEKKINRIHRNPLMSPLVKLTRIQHLKKKRNAEIAAVNSKYARWNHGVYSRR